ncbi:PH domain-containing protein [Mycolicibacterium neoaurum]|uniref:PH domain-containing protein n=1 Tax=Mycolicibacterium neoaurum TaxID=1795 RepID=UPI00248B8207|nr:PH domain-containing protein [Mycolicibacterium neoaurum]WBP95387.1 PH domain-containing protein [Mycolicibacterium neoaurum]WBS09069.1 PH domain-containing protein [Mycolicibacterium neoaurum]
MTRSADDQKWDLQVRPHLTPYFVYGAAFLIAAAHITVGFLLKVGSSGVVFRTADQVGIAAVGLVIAGCVLLLARPRLRVGPSGIAVRNALGYKLIAWPDVVDVSFPPGARWARIDLADDEYTAAMAIQAVDKERAVVAMDQVRTLMRRYQNEINSPSASS